MAVTEPFINEAYSSAQYKNTENQIDFTKSVLAGIGSMGPGYGKDGPWKKNGKTAATVAAGVSVASNLAKNQWGDNKDLNYTGTEKATDVLTTGADYAAMGATFGPWGAAVGGLVGLGVGVWDMNNKADKYAQQKLVVDKRMKESDAQKDRLLSIESSKKDYEDIVNNSTMFNGSYIARKGGNLKFNKYSILGKYYKEHNRTVMFKKGGTFKVKTKKLKKPIFSCRSVIMDGPLHSEYNNLGDKGLPIVTHDGVKVYEIETKELLLDGNSSDKLNENRDNPVKLGKVFVDILFNNTESKDDKYKCLNDNTCLI